MGPIKETVGGESRTLPKASESVCSCTSHRPHQRPRPTAPVAERRAQGANRGAARCRNDSRTVFRWPVQQPQGSSATVDALASVWTHSCLSLRAPTVRLLDSGSARGHGPACSSALVVRALHASVSLHVQRHCLALSSKAPNIDRASCTCPLPLAGHRARGRGGCRFYDFVPSQRSSIQLGDYTAHSYIAVGPCTSRR